jgi:hypothetical protein
VLRVLINKKDFVCFCASWLYYLGIIAIYFPAKQVSLDEGKQDGG